MTLLLALLIAQDAVDPRRVDAAIDRGARYLLEEAKRGIQADRHATGPIRRDELALYALLWAGVDRGDPTFQALVANALTGDLTHTYVAALTAMALEALDRRKHQGRIAQCAQFLIDNQCTNGQWSYGRRVALPAFTGGGTKKSGSTEALPPITLTRRSHGPATGDNSNSQYAALGLRACLESNIRFPAQVLADAERGWERSQQKDGGWGYGMDLPLGEGKDSYGSMTAGAVGALVIYKHHQKKDWAKAPSVAAGLQWMADHFDVESNPKAGRSFALSGGVRLYHYYWLYALERAGILAQTEELGKRSWYAEGATYLLKAQRADGRWSASTGPAGMEAGGDLADTCFAILFLRRSTRPITATTTAQPPRK